ncbi:gamma carbonic anhydrase family protein [Rhodococcoides yunnanense]|uniref:gamma carbonic anhydrase family protein n=1 Tax=Rhodococcoides yunnanense TaxID=278209 RepID=UPI000A5C2043|nr:gamma carbonic anhydrase family protein [Rhodococcus yunnanensis]
MNMRVTAATVVLGGEAPSVSDSAWVAPGSVLCGDVSVGASSSVWYQAVLRADCAAISIGARSSVQDGCVLHAGFDRPIRIGDDVTVGHRAVIHGAVIEDRVLIGMGSIVLNGVHVGSDSIVAAGSLLVEGFEVPRRSLVMGSPARVVRDLTDTEVARIESDARVYIDLAELHRNAESR